MKFGFDLDLEDVRRLEPEAFKDLVRKRAETTYNEREIEYPVMAGLYHFTTRDPGGHKRYDREKLAEWARDRFDVQLDIEDLKNKQRDEIRATLIERSRQYTARLAPAMEEAMPWVERIFPPGEPEDQARRSSVEMGRLKQLEDWLLEKYRYQLPEIASSRLTSQQLERHLVAAVEERYRPEMRRMERSLVLQLLDGAWKDHLLAMDHLKSSVGLRGYAQVDPKVEYKREGMKIYEQMWSSVGERVTDLAFKIEQLDERFVGSTWTEAEAIHEDAASAGEIAQQQQAAIEGTETDHKPQPIRHRGPRVGRNDPCPCGSGKKFKNCCMKK
jgi:preprotein translocase subunit SecA